MLSPAKLATGQDRTGKPFKPKILHYPLQLIVKKAASRFGNSISINCTTSEKTKYMILP
jgi:hypothetical protein